MKCSSNRRVTASLLLSFLAFPTATSAVEQMPLLQTTQPTIYPKEHTFSLRHIFHRGTYRDPDLHKRLDIKPHHEFVISYEEELPRDAAPPRLTARSNSVQIERLADRRPEQINEHLEYASFTGFPRILESHHWTVDDLPGPNTTDKETVVNLAIMAANAYVPKYHEGQWEDVTQGYNLSTNFGWEGDGLRGHIFADEGNQTIIVGLKGTSPAVFDGDGTTTKDKLNDNLFFSCCCGQGGDFFWRQACDCQASTYTCNSTCLVKALKDKTKYYTAALDLYANVTALYPNSTIWIVGHSLGGAVSAMIGLTFGIPVVTYEAPGDNLAVKRLGLPVPEHSNRMHPFQQKRTGAVHFGHTADPIFMGVCNGVTSPCTLGGYAMESQCHTGVQCVYDTVGDLGWRVGLGYHRIHDVIDNVIRKYDKVPKCEADSECVDCYNWKYFKSNNSDVKPPTTTSTTISSMTRTTTCQTPGWWGCLDDTTTSSTPVITTTYTTTSCAQPGWFGCNEEVNVTVTTTTAAPTTASASTSSTKTSTVKSKTASTTKTTTCETPGWFGDCWDDDITTGPKSTRTHSVPKTSDETSTSCRTPGLFFGCLDESTSHSRSRTRHTVSKTSDHTSCETPGVFFGCYDETTSHRSYKSTVMPSTSASTSTVFSSPTSSSISSTSTTSEHRHRRSCKHPALFGLICLD